MRPYLEITKFNSEVLSREGGLIANYRVNIEVVAFSPDNEIVEGSVKCVHYGQLLGGTKTEINIFPGEGTISGSGTCDDPYVVKGEFESSKFPGLWSCIATVKDSEGNEVIVKKGLNK